MRRIMLMLVLTGLAHSATLRGGFEGSNVVDIQEVSPDSFTCKLLATPRPLAENTDDAVHTMAHFMFAIEGAAGQTVTVTITNYGLNAIRAGNKGVYTEATDPYALATESTWQQLPDVTIANPSVTVTLTPGTDLVWVADGYPTTPSHIANWIAAVSPNPAVTVDTVGVTSRGRPIHMLFITNGAFPLAGKRGIIVYGREHPLEPTGSWTCQGLAGFLTSGDATATTLLQSTVFILIPDMSPDASAAGLGHHPDNGKCPQWHYNPAVYDRYMPGMWGGMMTTESGAIYTRLTSFVDTGGSVDVCLNIHEGGNDNLWGCYDTTDAYSNNYDAFLRSYMPSTGAPWVPNALEGYSRGGWQDYKPVGPFAIRLLGRCWEDWRTLPLGYEMSHGIRASNFLTNPDGIKYFGEAIARAAHDYFGSFAGTVTVTAPDGGEDLGSSGSETVTWTSTGPAANVRIDCSIDGGATWTNLATSTPNDGTQVVTLPDANSSSCRIRVADAAALGVDDESDADFTIGTPPSGTITITSPDGGEVWDANWMNTVAWSSTGSIDNVRIEVSIDDGATWRLLAYAADNTGSYRINVPNTPSSSCRVRVRGVQNGAAIDTSDATFTIRPTPALPALSVTTPNGGETFSTGTAMVTWTSTSGEIGNTVSNVGIALSTDEGGSWATLVSSTPNDGSAEITLPAVTSSRCLVWVFDAYNDPFVNSPDYDPFDVSDSLFSIGPATGTAPVAVETAQGLHVSIVAESTGSPVTIRLTGQAKEVPGLPGECRVTIFDTQGKVMRHLRADWVTEGAELVWNRTDNDGRPVGPGHYIFRVESPAGAVNRKVLIIH